MHLVGDDQRRHRKDRTSAEKFFKRANTFIVAIQLACFLIAISQISIAANKTFKGSMFFPRKFELERILDNKTGNCSLTIVDTYFSMRNVNVTVHTNNRGYFFARLAYGLRTVIGVNAATIVVGGANKLIMDLNKYEFHYHQLVIHKEVLTTIEIVLLCYNLYVLADTEMWASILRAFLDHCGVEADTSVPYVVPVFALYFAVSFALFCHVLTFVIHVVNATKKGGVTMEGVRAGAKGVIDMDPHLQYDEFGTPVLDGDGMPVLDESKLENVRVAAMASQMANGGGGVTDERSERGGGTMATMMNVFGFGGRGEGGWQQAEPIPQPAVRARRGNVTPSARSRNGGNPGFAPQQQQPPPLG